MIFWAILAFIGIGLAKAPQATVHGLNYVATHAMNWIVSFWQYLGGL